MEPTPKSLVLWVGSKKCRDVWGHGGGGFLRASWSKLTFRKSREFLDQLNNFWKCWSYPDQTLRCVPRFMFSYLMISVCNWYIQTWQHWRTPLFLSYAPRSRAWFPSAGSVSLTRCYITANATVVEGDLLRTRLWGCIFLTSGNLGEEVSWNFDIPIQQPGKVCSLYTTCFELSAYTSTQLIQVFTYTS
jgi:hypothetical protein